MEAKITTIENGFIVEDGNKILAHGTVFCSTYKELKDELDKRFNNKKKEE